MPINLEIRHILESEFNLTISELLPVTDSFSSDVLHFMAENGDSWVLKRPFSVAKARREAFWLNQHSLNPLTPTLKRYREIADHGYLLMNSLPGLALQGVNQVTESMAEQLGAALESIHQVGAKDFDGLASWPELLEANVERFMSQFSGDLLQKAKPVQKQFNQSLRNVPNPEKAHCIHFDFRIGNVLANRGLVSGVIDFESMRGGHTSMDFYKLWHEVWLQRPELKAPMLAGYGKDGTTDIEELLRIYSLYHGLGGLSWCAQRNQLDTDFAQLNYRKLNGEFFDIA